MMNEESTAPSRNPISLFFQRLSQVCQHLFDIFHNNWPHNNDQVHMVLFCWHCQLIDVLILVYHKRFSECGLNCIIIIIITYAHSVQCPLTWLYLKDRVNGGLPIARLSSPDTLCKYLPLKMRIYWKLMPIAEQPTPAIWTIRLINSIQNWNELFQSGALVTRLIDIIINSFIILSQLVLQCQSSWIIIMFIPTLVFLIELNFPQIYQGLLDKWTPHTKVRWVAAGFLVFLFLVRVFICQGWYIVCYALGIYHLNLFIAFLTPKMDPALDLDGNFNLTISFHYLFSHFFYFYWFHLFSSTFFSFPMCRWSRSRIANTIKSRISTIYSSITGI